MEINKFLKEPQELFAGQKAVDLIKTKSGREKLEKILAEIELVAELDYQNNEKINNKLKKIRHKLGLKESVNIFQDQVEELLVEKMKDDFFEDYISKAILLWRNYKSQEEEIRGNNNSWAAAVEYLICRLNCWNGTQQQIGDKYDVCAATISKRYRDLVTCLDSKLNLSLWRDMIRMLTN